MQKKRVGILILVIFAVLFSSIVLAANETSSDSEKINKAYTCLTGKVSGKCSTFNAEDQAFAMLALSYDSKLQSECKSGLMNNKKTDCWPSSSSGNCRLKTTALAILALNNINADTSASETWLINQNSTPSDLTWYLEVDSTETTQCKISYDTHTYTIQLDSNKKLSQGAGSCLALAQGDYWLQISSSCLSKTFSVSCDKSFTTALLYKRQGYETVYVSSEAYSMPPDGNADVAVKTLCFKEGSACSYEGSLWAALALQKKGKDVSAYLPYLIALEGENEKYLPEAFLYMLTGSSEYLTQLSQLKNPANFWLAESSAYGKYYDTALAILSLSSLTSGDADKAKTYLLEVQPKEGCWQNSVRDTSFILYSGWPKPPVSAGVSVEYCTSHNAYCIPTSECSANDKLSEYYCTDIAETCCKVQTTKTCSEMNGEVCSSDKECSGGTKQASDTNTCCTTGCIQKTEQDSCSVYGYTCKTACSTTEEAKSYSCSSGNICCGAKVTTAKSYWWLWLLIILIILIVLGIVFRKQLSVWIFKMKSGFRKSPAVVQQSGPRPPFSPVFPQRMMPRRIIPQTQRAVSRVASKSGLDKELDDTLKKLRDMSK